MKSSSHTASTCSHLIWNDGRSSGVSPAGNPSTLSFLSPGHAIFKLTYLSNHDYKHLYFESDAATVNEIMLKVSVLGPGASCAGLASAGWFSGLAACPPPLSPRTHTPQFSCPAPTRPKQDAPRFLPAPGNPDSSRAYLSFSGTIAFLPPIARSPWRPLAQTLRKQLLFEDTLLYPR